MVHTKFCKSPHMDLAELEREAQICFIQASAASSDTAALHCTELTGVKFF